jgi:hypothetical protein
MVWGAGEDCPRLDISQLEKGYQFWMIGDKRIANIKEMVAEILQDNALESDASRATR